MGESSKRNDSAALEARKRREKSRGRSLFNGIAKGDRMKLRGLTSARGLKLNGKVGTVLGYNASSGRLAVYLADVSCGLSITVRPENLEEAPSSGKTALDIAAVALEGLSTGTLIGVWDAARMFHASDELGSEIHILAARTFPEVITMVRLFDRLRLGEANRITRKVSSQGVGFVLRGSSTADERTMLRQFLGATTLLGVLVQCREVRRRLALSDDLPELLARCILSPSFGDGGCEALKPVLDTAEMLLSVGSEDDPQILLSLMRRFFGVGPVRQRCELLARNFCSTSIGMSAKGIAKIGFALKETGGGSEGERMKELISRAADFRTADRCGLLLECSYEQCTTLELVEESGEGTGVFKLCSGCRQARYCTDECARAAWPKHRKHCKGEPTTMQDGGSSST